MVADGDAVTFPAAYQAQWNEPCVPATHLAYMKFRN